MGVLKEWDGSTWVPVGTADTSGGPFESQAHAAATFETKAHASAAYEPIGAQPIGPKMVTLGDSTTRGGDDPTTPWLHQESWPTYLAILSGGQLLKLQNAGVNGDTSAGVLARFDTDVTPYAPNVVTLLIGVNDAAAATSLATYSANVTAIVQKIIAIGAVPVLCTITPNDTTATNNVLRDYNLWLRRYAAAHRFPLIDFNRVLTDPLSGGYLAAYDADGTHPNALGRLQMAQEAWAVLQPLVAPSRPPVGASSSEQWNLLAGAAFAADSNADGVADSWTTTGALGTHSLITPVGSDGATGKWQRLAYSGSTAGEYGVQQSIASGWSVGDTLAFCGRMRVGNITSTAFPRIFLQCTGAAHHIEVTLLTQPVSGVFYIEAQVPASTSALAARFTVDTPSNAATITLDVANVAVRNLTTLALGV